MGGQRLPFLRLLLLLQRLHPLFLAPQYEIDEYSLVVVWAQQVYRRKAEVPRKRATVTVAMKKRILFASFAATNPSRTL